MAAFVLKNAYVSVNSVDLSDHVQQVELSYRAEILDKTVMSNNSMARLAGLKDWQAKIRFYQDFASGKVDATLFSLIGAAAFTLAIRPDSGTIAATNPEFTGSALLQDVQPVAGSVGEMAMCEATFLGDGDLTRDVTP